MKIIGTTKYNTPCLWTCLGKGIEGLSKYINIPIIMYDQLEIQQGKMLPDEDEVVIIFEAGCFQHAGLSLYDVKRYFPNSKLVILAADTNIYLYLRGQHQVAYNLVDLWLDLDTRCINFYKALNINADQWMWTISDWFISYIHATKHEIQDRWFDYIGVYHIDYLKNGYRKDLLEYLKAKGLIFTNGGGNGHEDNDLNRLLSYYYRSYFTLGTTSHNIDKNFRTPKGFRDWIGPFTGSTLIYDNYPMIMECYGETVPYYEYDNFYSILELSYKLKSNKQLNNQYIQQQQQWAIENTIDKQLYRMLQKYELIRT